jgi:hypothetical protein
MQRKKRRPIAREEADSVRDRAEGSEGRRP